LTAPAPWPLTAAAGALAGIRVLDLAGPRANFATKLMAGLGADVIKVEPPEGDELRRRGPFPAGRIHPETSLGFVDANTNKRGITLNLETATGQRLFRKLAERADAVLETMPPGWMDSRGIGYSALSKLAPGLVYTAVTPFGQSGPRASYKATDLTTQAMGGSLFLTGEPGGRPVRAAITVADKMAGYTAATATVMALYHRNATGQGQFIDVSAQEAVVFQIETAPMRYWFTGDIRRRDGWRHPTVTCPAGLYPCVDGYVSIVASKPHQWTGLRDWIGDERLMKDEYMMEPNRFADRDFIDPIVAEWTKTMKKSVLFHEGQRRGVPIGECMLPEDMVRDVHLRSRGYFVPTGHPVLGEFDFPGPPFLMMGTPWRLRRPAPLLGEHNAEVFGELGLGEAEIAGLRREGIL
jgi:benzylsuccinate CoA-transferase BbsE subunit